MSFLVHLVADKPLPTVKVKKPLAQRRGRLMRVLPWTMAASRCRSQSSHQVLRPCVSNAHDAVSAAPFSYLAACCRLEASPTPALCALFLRAHLARSVDACSGVAGAAWRSELCNRPLEALHCTAGIRPGRGARRFCPSSALAARTPAKKPRGCRRAGCHRSCRPSSAGAAPRHEGVGTNALRSTLLVRTGPPSGAP